MISDWFLSTPLSVVWVLLGTGAMYFAVLLFARIAGVRSFAQMSAFDLAVTIAIGSMIATTVASRDPPLVQGMFAMMGLYALQLIVSRLRRRFASFRRVVDNRPILLMDAGGRMLHENMKVARVTEDDLRQELRAANVIDPGHVQAVVMEGTGNVHVLHHHDQDVSRDAWVLENVRDYSRSALRESTDPESAPEGSTRTK